MSFELDKRIKNITDIQSVTDGCQDWLFMTKKGYFANSIFNFKDLKRLCAYGEYAGWREHNQCFLCEQAYDETYYSYFLPEDSLLPKEPENKYRPLTNTEFVDLFDSGKLRSIRLKDNSTKRLERLIITDIYVQGDYLYAKLNSSDTGYGSAYFFSKCEYFDGKEWQPFGVIDEDKE